MSQYVIDVRVVCQGCDSGLILPVVMKGIQRYYSIDIVKEWTFTIKDGWRCPACSTIKKTEVLPENKG